MMTQAADNYAEVLLSLGVAEDLVKENLAVLNQSVDLKMALMNPAVTQSEKYKVIERIFDEEMQGFMKSVCDKGYIDEVDSIWEAYEDKFLNNQNIVKAQLTYVTEPDAEQMEQIKQMICKKYHKSDVAFTMKQNQALLGGFVLQVYDDEYDRSLKGSIKRLQKNLLGGERLG